MIFSFFSKKISQKQTGHKLKYIQADKAKEFLSLTPFLKAK